MTYGVSGPPERLRSVPATEGEVLHAQNLRRVVTRKPHRVDMAQQGFLRARLRYLSKVRARFASESEVDVREPAVETLGSAPAPAPAPAALSDAGQTLREERLLRSPS